ncbi:hypothetical protein GCM10010306_104290 [Streptomyces umbrinus]|uniref:hypothetical protein n=1 Tax=Streptomyces umbrinus TaxID=67370 RepID=UPI00167B7D02|nr:hypothetical protein GCM10010306_104290 [Streptomyces umbrinus]
MGNTRLEPVVLSEAERLTLESWAERRSTAQGLAVRARIVPACANGWNNTVAAARLGVGRIPQRRPLGGEIWPPVVTLRSRMVRRS